MTDASIRALLQEIKNSVARLEAALETSSSSSENNPWYPPTPEGFGPWIEYDGSGIPVASNIIVNPLVAYERNRKTFDPTPKRAGYWDWSLRSGKFVGGNIVAYCIKY